MGLVLLVAVIASLMRGIAIPVGIVVTTMTSIGDFAHKRHQ
jgi:hypothetical protein